MSVELESAARLNALKQGIEAKTGETYPDLTDGVNALIAGFGQGGGSGGSDGTVVLLRELIITEPVHEINLDFPRDWDIYDAIFIVPINVIPSEKDWLYFHTYVGNGRKGFFYFGGSGSTAITEWQPRHTELTFFKQDGVWYTYKTTGKERGEAEGVNRMIFVLYASGNTLNSGKFVFYGVKYEN